MNIQTGAIRTDAAGLAAVLYRSIAVTPREEFESAGHAGEFAARNLGNGITGYLHFEDGMFFQYIEGPAAAVARLWASIQRDTRHRDVTVLSQGAVGTRRFARWAMGYNDAEPRSLFDWTARSGLAQKGPRFPQVVTAFLEYASSAVPQPAR